MRHKIKLKCKNCENNFRNGVNIRSGFLCYLCFQKLTGLYIEGDFESETQTTL